MPRRAVVFCLFLLLMAGSAPARPDAPPARGGIHGRVEAGAAGLWTTDQLAASGRNERAGDLSGPAEPFWRGLPVALFDLRCRLPSAGLLLHAGTPMDAEGPPGLELGVRGDTRLARLDLTGFWQPLRRVWKDPYRTNAAREKTRAPIQGAGLRLERLLGSAWSVRYRLALTRVGDDEIGERFGSLRRDAVEHRVRLERSFGAGRGARIVPWAGYAWHRADGEAERFRGPRVGLELRRFSRAYTLLLTAGLRWDAYAGEHPVFGTRRRDLTCGAFGMVSVPLGRSRRYYASFLVGAFRRGSNIEFLEADTALVGVTAGLRF